MRVPFLIIFTIAIGGCEMRQVSSEAEHAQTKVVEVATPTPTAGEEGFPTVERISSKPLSRHQKRELDATLPPKVREVLERAETLEVLGLSSEDNAGIGWHPDVRTALPIGTDRSNLLWSFFFDASAGPNPSACFVPRHGLKATYKGKTVEVIICYECHLFAVKGSLGEFKGGFYRKGRRRITCSRKSFGPKARSLGEKSLDAAGQF